MKVLPRILTRGTLLYSDRAALGVASNSQTAGADTGRELKIGAESFADIARIRLAGFSDRAILDAAHVTGFFSYMNRVVQALGADSKGVSLTYAKHPRL